MGWPGHPFFILLIGLLFQHRVSACNKFQGFRFFSGALPLNPARGAPPLDPQSAILTAPQSKWQLSKNGCGAGDLLS